MVKFYFASQNRSHKYEFHKSILWSPKTNSSGSVLDAYKNMSNLKKGDIILNAYNACIHAISVVQNNAYNSKKPNAYGNEGWGDEGWQVDLDMYLIEIPLSPLKGWLSKHRQPKYDPFDKNGNINMSYLSRLSDEQVEFFKHYIENSLLEEVLAYSNDLLNTFNASPKNKRDKLTKIKNTNWEQINRIKAENGREGEEFVLKILKKNIDNENKDKYQIIPMSSNLAGVDGNDSVGYDILVKNERTGFIKYIDVKTTESNAKVFYMSSNEKNFMEDINQQENVDYYIYRVCLKSNDDLILNNIYESDDLKHGNFKPINYEVDMHLLN